MPDQSSNQHGAWPLPRFYFQVEWSANPGVMHFQEVSGLDVESQPIQYRHANSPGFAAVSMPGIRRYGAVTLKKGVLRSDDQFWNWYNQVKMNTTKPGSVTISLLDESGQPTMVWTLTNAWPTKISGADLRGDGNEVNVESIEIAHEGLRVSNSQ